MAVLLRLMPRLVTLLAVIAIGLASVTPHHASASGVDLQHAENTQAFDCLGHLMHVDATSKASDGGAVPADGAPACCNAISCAFHVPASGLGAAELLDWSSVKLIDPQQHVATIAPAPLRRPPRAI